MEQKQGSQSQTNQGMPVGTKGQQTLSEKGLPIKEIEQASESENQQIPTPTNETELEEKGSVSKAASSSPKAVSNTEREDVGN